MSTVYETTTIFSLDDKVTKSLQTIINKGELAGKVFDELTKSILAGEKALTMFGAAAGQLVPRMAEVGRVMTSANTKFSNMVTRSQGVNAALDTMGIAAGAFETRMALVNDTLAQTVLELREIRANSNINMRINNRGGVVTGAGARGGHGGTGFDLFGNTINALVTGQLIEQMVAPAFHPAMEYQGQANRLQSLPITLAEQQSARRGAMDIATKTPNATPTEAMEAIIQSFGISQSMPLAIQSAGITAQMSTILMANRSKMPGMNENMEKITQTMERAAELLQRLPTSPGDTEGLAKQKDFYAKATNMFIQEGGTVTPEAFLREIKYARAAGVALDDKALFTTLPTMIQQIGMGSGKMYAQYNRMFTQGVMPKSALQTMMALGAIDPKQATAKGGGLIETSGTHDLVTRGLVDPEGFRKDPQEWTVKHILTPLLKMSQKHGEFKSTATTDEGLLEDFDKIPASKKMTLLGPALSGMAVGNSDQLVKFAIMDRQLRAKEANRQNMDDFDTQYEHSLQNVNIQLQQFGKEIKTTATIIGDSNLLMSPMVSTLKTINKGLNDFNMFLINLDKIFPFLSKATGGKTPALVQAAVDMANPFKWADEMGFKAGAAAASIAQTIDKMSPVQGTGGVDFLKNALGDASLKPAPGDVSALPPMPLPPMPQQAAPVQQNITVNMPGEIAHKADLMHEMTEFVARMFTKYGIVHMGTSGQAGGNLNAPALNQR